MAIENHLVDLFVYLPLSREDISTNNILGERMEISF